MPRRARSRSSARSTRAPGRSSELAAPGTASVQHRAPPDLDVTTCYGSAAVTLNCEALTRGGNRTTRVTAGRAISSCARSFAATAESACRSVRHGSRHAAGAGLGVQLSRSMCSLRDPGNCLPRRIDSLYSPKPTEKDGIIMMEDRSLKLLRKKSEKACGNGRWRRLRSTDQI